MLQLETAFQTAQCPDHNTKKQSKKATTKKTKSVEGCSKVCKLINDNYKNLNSKLAEQFYNYVTNACLEKNINTLYPVIAKMLKQYKPNKHFVIKLLGNTKYDECFKNFVITGDDINLIIKRKFREKVDFDFINTIINNMEMNADNVMKLCCYRNKELLDRLALILDKVEGKFKAEMLYSAYKFYPESKNVIIALCGRGLTFNNECLVTACMYCSADCLDEILSYNKVELDDLHFNIVVDSVYPQVDSYPTHRDYCESSGRQSYIEKKITVLVKHGYKYDRMNVIRSIKLGLKLPNLHQSGIVFDKEMIDLCIAYKFCPFDLDDLDGFLNNKNETGSIKSGMDLLRLLCGIHDLSKIRLIIQKYNLIPDEDCMTEACRFKSNIPAIKYLFSKGGIITTKCIRTAMMNSATHAFMNMLIDNYMRHMWLMTERCKQFEEQILGLGSVPTFEFEKVAIDIQVNDDEVNRNKAFSTTPKTFQFLFSVRDKNWTYDKVKAHLSKTIVTNSWVIAEDNRYIDLPTNIRDILDLGEGYVRFADIDKLTSLFYRIGTADVDDDDDTDSEIVDFEDNYSDPYEEDSEYC